MARVAHHGGLIAGGLGRAAALVALCSAAVHVVVAIDDRGAPAAILMIAFAVLCASCARALWTRPGLRVWATVATMYGAMLALHAGLALAHTSAWAPLRSLGEATHPAHQSAGATSWTLEVTYLAVHVIPVLQLGICLIAMTSLWLQAHGGDRFLESPE